MNSSKFKVESFETTSVSFNVFGCIYGMLFSIAQVLVSGAVKISFLPFGLSSVVTISEGISPSDLSSSKTTTENFDVPKKAQFSLFIFVFLLIVLRVVFLQQI